MKQLQIRSFGSFRIMLDELPFAHSLKTEKSRALFLYLLIEHDRPHRRACLIDLLWPAAPDRAAHHSLRQSLYRIRSLCAAALDPVPFALSTSSSDVQLLLGAGFRVDAFDLNRQLAQCETHHKHPSLLCNPCLESLISVVELYSGDFMDGFSLRDAPQFDWWLHNKRENFHRQVLKALTWITHTLLSKKDYVRAINIARREVELDPWSEPAYQQYMVALALAGERVKALQQFEICQQILATEIGIEPSRETRCLREQIRNDALVLPNEVIDVSIQT